MIVLDASVVIAYLSAPDRHHESAVSLLLDQTGTPLAISALTLAEVLVTPTRAGRSDEVIATLDALSVETLPVEKPDARRLAALRTTSDLRLPDCCVLGAAERYGARLATFDGGLARTARSRGVTVLGT